MSLTMPLVLGWISLISQAGAEPPEVKRGYTIPVLDLSADADRVTTVDRDPRSPLGPSSTVLLDDGQTMIIVYAKGTGPAPGPIVMRRSTNGGKTWSARLSTPRSWFAAKDIPTIHRLTDAEGKKRLIVFSGQYPIRMASSEDDGAKWSELTPIGEFGGLTAMSSVIALKTGPGHYMALFHDDGKHFTLDPRKKGLGFRVYKTVTTDGGRTWGTPEMIATDKYANLAEPCAIRSPDGKQIAVLLRESRRFKPQDDPNDPKELMNSFVIFSDDEGKTWSKPRELPGALTGDRHVAVYAPDGRLVIGFRDTTHESKTRGDWVAWVGQYDDIVKGTEGQYRVRLRGNFQTIECGYTGLSLLPDGTFVATSYGNWSPNAQPYIVSVRFTLPELDKMLKR